MVGAFWYNLNSRWLFILVLCISASLKVKIMSWYSHRGFLSQSLMNNCQKMTHGEITKGKMFTRMQKHRTGMSGLIRCRCGAWPDQAPLPKFRLLMHRKVWACKMWNKISAQDTDIPGRELRSSDQSLHCTDDARWVTGGDRGTMRSPDTLQPVQP